VLREIDFLLKNLGDRFESVAFVDVWRLIAWTQISASLNQRKVKKAELSRLIQRKFASNLEFNFCENKSS